MGLGKRIKEYRNTAQMTQEDFMKEKIDIEKAREEGKRNYQKIIMCLASGMIALVVTMMIAAVSFGG